MEELRAAIKLTPIIDHHAHNLLLPSQLDAHPLLSITSEATGAALEQATSTLPHLRAVKQLAAILDCEESWDLVKAKIGAKRQLGDNSWEKFCFRGIETVLIDDGLDADTVYPYQWHDSLTRSKCKRIVRVEKVAETILCVLLKQYRTAPQSNKQSIGNGFMNHFLAEFRNEIKDALGNGDVVGFKTVICYRTSLAIPYSVDFDKAANSMHAILWSPNPEERFRRLADEILSPYLVHVTAELLTQSKSKKPFQFHTGLGDNDIRLRLSSSSHLQPFIEKYPLVSIVLLHASYPFTKEAAYLASTYRNVYLDIGEVFPMISQGGQESVIKEALELCPSEKLMWSTDGHWYPETFLLATLQVREGLEKVLCDYVQSQSLSVASAIKIVHDVLFSTSNDLYNLDLSLTPIEKPNPIHDSTPTSKRPIADVGILKDFLLRNPSVEYLRLQWLDYTSTARLRIMPIQHALAMSEEGNCIGVTKAVFGLLQEDELCPGFQATGKHDLYPIFESLRLGIRAGHATVQCEFRHEGRNVAGCPRTSLHTIIDRANFHGISFLVGFEIEVVFMSWNVEAGTHRYGASPVTQGHCWSSSRPLHGDTIMGLVESIVTTLKRSGIDIQQFHAESAPGQFEFVLSPQAPLAAVDTLLAAREIIATIAGKHAHALRATYVPKAYPEAAGSGAHFHISMVPPGKHRNFLAGVLKHLPAIAAFTFSNEASYERVADSVWSGGTWIAWGTQNRETPVRYIENSRYEIKCMDGLANPYLALSAVLGAGFQGVLDSDSLDMKDCQDDPAKLEDDARKALGITRQLPKSFAEALDFLEADAQLKSILGGPVCATYKVVKTEEAKKLEQMDPEMRRAWLIERY